MKMRRAMFSVVLRVSPGFPTIGPKYLAGIPLFFIYFPLSQQLCHYFLESCISGIAGMNAGNFSFLNFLVRISVVVFCSEMCMQGIYKNLAKCRKMLQSPWIPLMRARVRTLFLSFQWRWQADLGVVNDLRRRGNARQSWSSRAKGYQERPKYCGCCLHAKLISSGLLSLSILSPFTLGV